MTEQTLTHIPFIKMHGLGNDFVVIDDRARKHGISPEQARAIGDRRRGVGFDQLLVLSEPRDESADVFMYIMNPDGSMAEACGNGTRCVAALMMKELGKDRVIVETVAGLLGANISEEGLVTVNMGTPRFGWSEIPLSQDVDTQNLDLSIGSATSAVAVNIGNPHAVFFTQDAEAINLETIGPPLENNPLFPEKANIEVATLIGEDRIRMRVWERGAGITMACGSGACATAVAANLRGLVSRKSTIVLDGGELIIEWDDQNNIWMTGPAATSFYGTLDPSMFALENRGESGDE